MKRLIDGFQALFAGTLRSGGKLADTAGFTLAKVNWAADPERPEPASNAVVQEHLEKACNGEERQGPNAHALARALLPVAGQLGWRMRAADRERTADMIAFSRNFTAVTVIEMVAV